MNTQVDNLIDHMIEQKELKYQQEYSQRASEIEDTCPSKLAYLMKINPYTSKQKVHNTFYSLIRRHDEFPIDGKNIIVETKYEIDPTLSPLEKLSDVSIITNGKNDFYNAWVDGKGLPTLALDEQTDKIAAQYRCEKVLEALKRRVLGF